MQPVGAVAHNNPQSFADAVEAVIEMRKRDRNLPSLCQQQAENFPWSSTISLMLTLHGELPQRFKRSLRAA
jgi:alpha-1,6-mannosyltransferase